MFEIHKQRYLELLDTQQIEDDMIREVLHQIQALASKEEYHELCLLINCSTL